MATATQNDISRLFPGVQDHTVQELLAAKATVNELEAALLLLEDEDEGLVEYKRQKGDRINRLVRILAADDIKPPDEPD